MFVVVVVLFAYLTGQ